MNYLDTTTSNSVDATRGHAELPSSTSAGDTSLAFCIFYAVVIAAVKLERPDLTGSTSYFA